MSTYSALFRSISDFSSSIRESQRLGQSWRSTYQEGKKLAGAGEEVGVKSEAGSGRAAKAARRAGTAMTVGITIPLAAAATAAVNTYAEFETAIVSAGSKSNATADQLQRMKKAALEVGNTTKFSAREAASGMDVLAAAGFNAEESITALAPVTKAAQAANEDLALTAGVVAKSLNAFNLRAQDAAHVADVLAQASNTTALDMHGLQDALGQAGEVGARYGQKLEDVVAITGRLVDMGVPAASAGTAVRQALTSLAAPTAKANTLLEDLGIATRDARGEMLPIPDLVRNVQKGLDQGSPAWKKYSSAIGLNEDELKKWAKQNGMTVTQAREVQAAVSKGGAAFQDYATKTLFGVEGAKAFSLAMSDGKPVLIDINKETDKMTRLTDGLARKMGVNAANAFIRAHTSGGQFAATGADAVEVISALGVASDGTAESIGKAFQQTTAQKIDNLKGSVETLAITVVDKLAPGLNNIVDRTTSWVTAISDFSEAHPQVTKTAVAFLALTAAAGPTLIIGGQLVSAVKLLGGAFNAGRGLILKSGEALVTWAVNADTANARSRTLAAGAGRFASFLGGPWGIAIGIAVTAVAGFALAQKKAADEAKGFTDSLTFQNGALDDNSRAMLADKLAKEGSLDAAIKAGVAEADYLKALTSGGDARAKMISDLRRIAEEHTTVTYNGYGTTTMTDKQGKAARKAADALQAMGTGLDNSARQSKQASNAIKGQVTTESLLKEQSEKLAGQQKQLAEAQTRVKTETNKVIDAFTILKKGSLSAERAAIKYEEGLDGITRSAKENGKSLDRNTASGRANRTAFLDALEAVNEKITADFKATAKTDGLSKATKNANKDLRQAEKDIRAQAKAAGLSKTETDKMIKQMLKTPKELRTSVNTPGLKKAKDDVRDFDKAIENTKGKTIGIKAELAINTSKGVKDWNAALTKKYGKSARLIAAKAGGPIQGDGNGTSDSIPMLGSDGEHVWTKRETEAAGGHSAVAAIRKAVLEGAPVLRRARGGPINNGPLNRGAPNAAKGRLLALMGEFSTKGFPKSYSKHGVFGRLDDLVAGKALAGNNQRAASYFAGIQKLIKDSQTRSAAAAAAAAAAASSGGGNGGYSGPVSGGAAGIRRIANSFHPSYIAAHRDPQGGPAFDIGSSGKKNTNIGNALRANHGKLGLRYVIRQMRIASAKSGWGWRGYTPITGSGDFRHVNHVHVSYARGTKNARRGLALVGENGPELVNLAGGEQIKTNQDSLAYLSGLENLSSQLSALVGSPSMALSRMPEKAGARAGGDTIHAPIYYARDTELSTQAAQTQVLRALKDRTRRDQQSG